MKLSRILAIAAAAVTVGALGAAVQPAAPASAAPAGDNVVINEVYGGGGNSGSTYTHDFIELYNPANAPISIDGWALHYASASGGWGGTTTLAGTIAPGGYFLVQQSAGSGGTEALPEPDAVGSLSMSGTTGRVILTSSADRPSSPPAGDFVSAGMAGYVDGIGWGPNAAGYEGSAAAATQNATSTARVSAGVDTDNNANDFATGTPTPQNSGGEGTTPPTTTPPTTPPPGPATPREISEIQGPGMASPFEGDTVETTGVVTAVYATGGLGGFNIQEPGEADPASHDASTGIFVYGPSFATSVEIGDSVSVTGVVGERFGSTQISASAVTQLVEPLAPVVPAAVEWPETDDEREVWEHMLIEPAGTYIVADNYSLNQYGEIGLAVGDQPLVTPTEAGAPLSDEAQAQLEYNEAHSVILDDGATTDFLERSGGSMVNAHLPLPYLTIDNPVRVGAEVSFTDPVVVHFDYSSYRFQPTVPLTGDNPEDAPATFENDRTTSPADVGGSLTLGTFNVLNYFTSLGEDYCTANQNYRDRDGNPIAANNCLPRGAWDTENFERQQVKIVEAINALDTDIVSLEEIEDSSDFGLDRDTALSALVDALNEAAGSEKWAYVPSPSVIPATGDDVIRTAFIYQPATVELDGESEILDDAAFSNGRAPLSQTFVDSASGEKLVVIVNHFKSKGGSGSGDNEDRDDAVGPAGAVGGWNGDRTRQAEALVAFADEQQAAAGTDLVFLVGDFNAYSKETPATTIEAAGYANLTSTMSDNYSYLFDGTVGSLDHVFASNAALEYVTGADVWPINANEQIAQEYSRYNYNIVPLYDETMFRSSDHNPAVVGLQLSETPPTTEPPVTTPPTTEPPVTTPPTTEPPVTTPPTTEPVPGEPTVSVPGVITDAELSESGLPVEAAGFEPEVPVTVEILYPDGTSITVEFEDPATTMPAVDGTLAFTVWSQGIAAAGDYRIVLTQGDLTASAEFTVIASVVTPTTPGATTPGATAPPAFDGGEDLARTGGDDTAWAFGLGAVLLAAGALTVFGLRRRQAAG
ncbi:hypothetical protein GCM10011490_23290 [Pseudoclavibacter endophyticus]|uniref:ExeM/NucH family extracellular endonuclease n=1 Tax=Pseudoclavibacter endophyticus TaxID=1778590 RepID=A0A6H9WCE3_9MICO|nr:ExeM/NucH family extracellular endonuclease [Pseudoclavibacter endophyticus]KAB1648350.1 ExeM/NucH family extracellular endonuclease [Pseudoclavibacter endophyticus]GGA71882.1 hypothetical protein GCM10011490_23290 [Pseudoclavibacter endophyticus]